MEVRKQPRTDAYQKCIEFSLRIEPRSNIFNYADHLDNVVHTFDVPRAHRRLIITADALVEVSEPPVLPEALEPECWQELDAATADGTFWDMLKPSKFIQTTDLLRELAADLGCEQRQTDPLTMLRVINAALYETLDYQQETTAVDSPIDHALAARKGVCQDFAHIMITLVRNLGIPCRYISGYLYTGADDNTRSADDASHAWVEAWLPGLDWVSFDPTNNIEARNHHVRVGIGRDYADVPPTHGVFKGEATSELGVGVQVKLADNLPFDDIMFHELQHQPPAYAETSSQQEQQQQ
jgi:transglutaminase-like putative cysteine protease